MCQLLLSPLFVVIVFKFGETKFYVVQAGHEMQGDLQLLIFMPLVSQVLESVLSNPTVSTLKPILSLELVNCDCFFLPLSSFL